MCNQFEYVLLLYFYTYSISTFWIVMTVEFCDILLYYLYIMNNNDYKYKWLTKDSSVYVVI